MSRADQQLRRKRRQERRNRHRPVNAYWNQDEFEAPPVKVYRYEVTPEPMEPDGDDPANAPEMDDFREQIHAEMYENPAEAIPKLEAMLRRLPDSQLLMNWLAAAYARSGEDAKSAELSLRNYQLHPDYLFARVNHAENLMRQGKLEKAAAVMDNMWDLKQLYPHRTVFHTTEFLAMSHVAIEYFMRTGNLDAAESLYEAMREIAPDHDITRDAGSVIKGSMLLRLAKGLFRRWPTRQTFPGR
jgi:tetratricopeptide (TPR) repeat protein